MEDLAMADVLVVGAGPVGLTLAGELARHGVRCRIVDRLTQPLPYCRAIGITPRTLEVWEDMGVVRDIIDAGLWLVGSRSVVDGRLSDAEEMFPDLPVRPTRRAAIRDGAGARKPSRPVRRRCRTRLRTDSAEPG